MSLYLFLRFLHVLAAIVAVGTNATYGLLLARAHREQQHLRHVRESVRALDRNVANPAYAVLLITGLLMVWIGPLSITTPWLLSSLVLFLLTVGARAGGADAAHPPAERGPDAARTEFRRIPAVAETDQPDKWSGRADRPGDYLPDGGETAAVGRQ